MNSEVRDKQRRKELMLRAVQDQMTSAETPEVRVHYERLRSLGQSDAQARELIATVLAFYIWHTMRKDDYSYSDYVDELARLPQIDWEENENDDS
jgi:hypothetical protein